MFSSRTFKVDWISVWRLSSHFLNEKALPVRQNERNEWMVAVDDREMEELMRNEEGRRKVICL